MSGNHLLDVAVQLTHCLLLALKQLSRSSCNDSDGNVAQWNHDEKYQ